MLDTLPHLPPILAIDLLAEVTPSNFETTWLSQLFGIGMWPLWICSFILITLIIDRARNIRSGSILDRPMMDDVADHLARTDVAAATARAGESATVTGQAWQDGLKEFSVGGVTLSEALTNASLLALKPLKRNLQAISTIAAIAPLLGLLGTIVGMILAFSRIADTGGADKSQLAGAISLALFTTAGGILVAIPAIIAGRYFAAKLVGYSEEIEAAIDRANRRYQHAAVAAANGDQS